VDKEIPDHQPPKIILMAAEEKRARTLSSDPGIDDGG